MKISKTTIEPLGDRVAIRPIEEQAMKGMIYLPENARDKPVRGVVIAAGPGREGDDYTVPMKLKTGDVVIYGKYSGTVIEWEGSELILIREVDVLAKVNE